MLKKAIRVSLLFILLGTETGWTISDAEVPFFIAEKFSLEGRVYRILYPIADSTEGHIFGIQRESDKKIFAVKIYKSGRGFEGAESKAGHILKVLRQNRSSAIAPIASGKINIHSASFHVQVFPYFRTTIADLVQKNKLFPIARFESMRTFEIVQGIADVSLQLLRLLNYLGKAEVLHLDIKPSNIAIKFDLNFGIGLSFIDWGTAQSFTQELPSGRLEPLGTKGYNSPERVIGGSEPLSQWSEFYSIAASIYYMFVSKELWEPMLCSDLDCSSPPHSFKDLFDDPVHLKEVHTRIFSELYQLKEQLLNSLPQSFPSEKRVAFETSLELITTLIVSGLQFTPRGRVRSLRASKFGSLISAKLDGPRSLQKTFFDIPPKLKADGLEVFLDKTNGCGKIMTNSNAELVEPNPTD